jgi:segregation and condensation protein A
MSFELKDKHIDADKVLYKETTLPEEVRDYREPVDYEELVADITLSKMQNIFK